jgi:predicted RNA binding protein YcfA (HicA-like mRNA interferase family)
MKIPRDVSGDRLVALLRRFGYQVLRQKGSHVRLRHDGPPAHQITVPRHDTVKVGTLQAIPLEVAQMRSVDVDELANKL